MARLREVQRILDCIDFDTVPRQLDKSIGETNRMNMSDKHETAGRLVSCSGRAVEIRTWVTVRSAQQPRGNVEGNGMITTQTLTDYVRRAMPDATVTVTDKTGTMDHLIVRIVSRHFAGKNLLDRHRMIYQALDATLKDGRIHALELSATTPEEA